MNAHVNEILVEDGRAVGIRLKNGKIIKAKKAVVSNATPFDTVKMLGKFKLVAVRLELDLIRLSSC